MKEFIYLLRDHGLESRKNPELHADIVSRFADWTRSLRDSGAFRAAAQLTEDGGSTARKRDGEPVIDGPFSETKEIIAGFYHIVARDLEEASRIAASCPLIAFGGSIEVREILNGDGDCG